MMDANELCIFEAYLRRYMAEHASTQPVFEAGRVLLKGVSRARGAARRRFEKDVAQARAAYAMLQPAKTPLTLVPPNAVDSGTASAAFPGAVLMNENNPPASEGLAYKPSPYEQLQQADMKLAQRVRERDESLGIHDRSTATQDVRALEAAWVDKALWRPRPSPYDAGTPRPGGAHR